MFTDSADTIQSGTTALHIISLGFIISAVSITCSGSLEGLGMGGKSLLISLMRYVVVIMPAAYFFCLFFQARGVWIAFCFTEFITAGFALMVYAKKLSNPPH